MSALPPITRAGHIYDLGYRRYEGPRLGRAHAIRSLVVHSFRTTYGLGRSGRANRSTEPVAVVGYLASERTRAQVLLVVEASPAARVLGDGGFKASSPGRASFGSLVRVLQCSHGSRRLRTVSQAASGSPWQCRRADGGHSTSPFGRRCRPRSAKRREQVINPPKEIIPPPVACGGWRLLTARRRPRTRRNRRSATSHRTLDDRDGQRRRPSRQLQASGAASGRCHEVYRTGRRGPGHAVGARSARPPREARPAEGAVHGRDAKSAAVVVRRTDTTCAAHTDPENRLLNGRRRRALDGRGWPGRWCRGVEPSRLVTSPPDRTTRAVGLRESAAMARSSGRRPSVGRVTGRECSLAPSASPPVPFEA